MTPANGGRASLHVGAGRHRYRWIDDWAGIPDDEPLRTSWAHHALTVTRSGDVVGVHPATGHLLVLAPDGRVRRSLDCGLVEGHGLTVVEEDGTEYVWVADMGMRAVPRPSAPMGYEALVPDPAGTTTITLPSGETVEAPVPRGRVVKVRLHDGERVCELPSPQHDAYDERPYIPTAVAVAPDGSIWVADGYGASLLHVFAADGRLRLTLTGEESGAGRLDCPHALLVDQRSGEAEMYVADRENWRLVVFDPEGGFRREVAPGVLARPAALATHGDLLIVAELRARVTLLDREDRVVGHLGDNELTVVVAGWPNALADGELVRPTVTPGRFNCPHGLAADRLGSLYVTEWVIGARYTKLVPATGSRATTTSAVVTATAG